MGTPLKAVTSGIRAPLVVGGIMLAVLLSACGGDANDNGSASSSTGDQPRYAPAANFPQPSGRSMRDLIGNLPQGPVLAPSVTILEPGHNRFGFALFDAGRRQIGELEAALYVSRGVDETAHGPFPAKFEPIDVKPQFESQTTAQDPDAAQSVYVSRVAFQRAGSYLVTAVTKLDNKLVATSPTQVTVRAGSRVPNVGDQAISVHTPTVTSVHGDVKSIDTRVPPDDMHKVDLADALRRHRPVVLLFATPALCQSRVCGPVVDVAEQVKAQYGDKVDFIHMEIYNGNDLNKGPRPQFTAYGLRNEPILFAIDRRGVVAERLEGAYSAGELEAAVRKALG
jgi:hypothetical protein